MPQKELDEEEICHISFSLNRYLSFPLPFLFLLFLIYLFQLTAIGSIVAFALDLPQPHICIHVFEFGSNFITQGQHSYFDSSVRSSNSHPDLLLITSTHFFRSHRSSTLDFHFLSHYSYINGNHWTHQLATCLPYKYNRTSLQDSAR